jgi:hypothetical protein
MFIVRRQRLGGIAINVDDDDKIYYVCLFRCNDVDCMVAYAEHEIIGCLRYHAMQLTNKIGPIEGARNAHRIATELSNGTRGWQAKNQKAIYLQHTLIGG